jgi:hydrogenase nickel incorporation protein HypA/HybF
MHERALVSKTALDLLSLAGDLPVSKVTLATSPETSPEVVAQAWRSATDGTSVGAATLTCVVRDHGLQCLDCGARYRGDKLSSCPECEGNGLIVDPAPEVMLKDWAIGEVI